MTPHVSSLCASSGVRFDICSTVGEKKARAWHSAQRWAYITAAFGSPDGLLSTLNLVPGGGGGAASISVAVDVAVKRYPNRVNKVNRCNRCRLLMVRSPSCVILDAGLQGRAVSI